MINGKRKPKYLLKILNTDINNLLSVNKTESFKNHKNHYNN